MDTEGRNGSFTSLIESLIFFLPSVPPFCSFMFAFSEAHLHVTSESCTPQKYIFEVCAGFCSEAAAALLTGVSRLHNSSTFHLVKLDYFLCRVFCPRSTLKLLFIFSLFPSHCDFFNGNFRSVLNEIRGSFISIAIPLLFLLLLFLLCFFLPLFLLLHCSSPCCTECWIIMRRLH